MVHRTTDVYQRCLGDFVSLNAQSCTCIQYVCVDLEVAYLYTALCKIDLKSGSSGRAEYYIGQ